MAHTEEQMIKMYKELPNFARKHVIMQLESKKAIEGDTETCAEIERMLKILREIT